MGRLDGKVALITGTGGGQGRAAAQIFAREGAKVVGCDLKVEGNRETRALIEAEGGTIITLEPLDLTSREEAARFADAAIAAWGKIDILYNNASAQNFTPFPDITAEEWRFTMNNDLEIVFPLTQYVWPLLVQNGGGSIINTASGAGLIASTSAPMVAHATAKAGVMGFTRALAAEGLAHQIRVNSIAPGLIETPVLKEHLDDATRAGLEASVPIGRIGMPEDIAYYALFLASDESTYITGTMLAVDGGVSNILLA
jgi:meso-butanediol dehydrogenase/(S,S)-butanediol dehydrogenase/diacetyl reductase